MLESRKTYIHFLVEDETVKMGLGSNAGILLNHFRVHLKNHKSEGTHTHEKDGKQYTWTYNSAAGLLKIFPYMGTRQNIQKILKKMVEGGFLINGNFNKRWGDKTSWYTIPDEFSMTTTVVTDDNHSCHGRQLQLSALPSNPNNLKSISIGDRVSSTPSASPNGSSKKKETDPVQAHVNEVIGFFKDVNSNYTKLFVRKQERKAAEWLISKFSDNQIKKFIEFAVKLNSIEFGVKVYSPHEMVEKWDKFKDSVKLKLFAKDNDDGFYRG